MINEESRHFIEKCTAFMSLERPILEKKLKGNGEFGDHRENDGERFNFEVEAVTGE